jgi:transposase
MTCDTAWHELIVGGEAMANAMLDARQEHDSYQRIEVITGTRRRRRWTAEEKARIVGESFEAGANISEVARRHGVARGLLTVWRHKFSVAADARAPRFVPIQICSESPSGTADEPGRLRANGRLQDMASPAGQYCRRIEIEVSGARICVEPGVDASTLATVLSALRGGQ